MSIETWSTEFYPIPANDASLDTDIKRVEHSLQKWKGLRKENLAKHNLSTMAGRVSVIGYEHLVSASDLIVDRDSCALCVAYDEPYCTNCPLFKQLGCECWFDTEQMQSPYDAFISDNNPEPMIAALEATLKSLRN